MEAHQHAKLFTGYLFRLTLSDLDKILAANRDAINQQLNGNLVALLDAELKTAEIVKSVFAKSMSDEDINYLNDLLEALRKE